MIAVIGENVHQLGFLYALMPVSRSVLLLLLRLWSRTLSTDPKRHYSCVLILAKVNIFQLDERNCYCTPSIYVYISD